MHFHGPILRQVIISLTLGAVMLAGALLTTMTSVSAAPSGSAATTGTFTLKGSIAGGIRTIQGGQTLTYVFTEANHRTHGRFEDLVLTKAVNVEVTAMTCVRPGGAAINPDTPSCEPGFVKPGQRASMVVTTTVNGASGAAAKARVCLFNEATNVYGPCKTLSVAIG